MVLKIYKRRLCAPIQPQLHNQHDHSANTITEPRSQSRYKYRVNTTTEPTQPQSSINYKAQIPPLYDIEY